MSLLVSVTASALGAYQTAVIYVAVKVSSVLGRILGR